MVQVWIDVKSQHKLANALIDQLLDDFDAFNQKGNEIMNFMLSEEGLGLFQLTFFLFHQSTNYIIYIFFETSKIKVDVFDYFHHWLKQLCASVVKANVSVAYRTYTYVLYIFEQQQDYERVFEAFRSNQVFEDHTQNFAENDYVQQACGTSLMEARRDLVNFLTYNFDNMSAMHNRLLHFAQNEMDKEKLERFKIIRSAWDYIVQDAVDPQVFVCFFYFKKKSNLQVLKKIRNVYFGDEKQVDKEKYMEIEYLKERQAKRQKKSRKCKKEIRKQLLKQQQKQMEAMGPDVFKIVLDRIRTQAIYEKN
ncbi:hypothetical protein RFI_03166 [Reticulomyxa filosa]|uniref:Uncharacterized protein n=1 Tax=Reticulomyxa filosa TaxID=46433 RepID=X6P5Z7_RETFI|nr:hypothetical protein RFI_03166 [Reticulomyxa filosa]|eukprot:ETO33930.1 hypothetical protein RFI_03166 [Reticulomyxa filosa]